MKNRNAYIGKNVETMFKNSIGDRKDIIEKINKYFDISGTFENAIVTGVHGEKGDVKMGFSCGRNIDVNVKAYKESIAFNQLTRTTLKLFCERFDLDCLEYLQDLFLKKAKNSRKVKLFPAEEQERILSIFQPITRELVEWSMSFKKSREILALYERQKSIMRIYPMKEVLKNLDYDMSFTSKDNILIGKCISIQRKGGNGVHIHGIKNKTDPTHPGNNIQFKLKVNDFVKQMETYKLAQYVI